jgi:hypothetical protein
VFDRLYHLAVESSLFGFSTVFLLSPACQRHEDQTLAPRLFSDAEINVVSDARDGQVLPRARSSTSWGVLRV